METEEIRAPVLWRRPHAKIYTYNEDFSSNYYSVVWNTAVVTALCYIGLCRTRNSAIPKPSL